MNGYADGTFKPDVTINRAEFTKILIGVLAKMPDFSSSLISVPNCMKDLEKMKGDKLYGPFSDVDYTAWYGGTVCQAKYHNVVRGDPDGRFRPNDTINIAEAAKIFFQVFDPTITDEERQQLVQPDMPWYALSINTLMKLDAFPESVTANIDRENMDYRITRGEMAEMIYRIQTGKSSAGTSPISPYEPVSAGSTVTVLATLPSDVDLREYTPSGSAVFRFSPDYARAGYAIVKNKKAAEDAYYDMMTRAMTEGWSEQKTTAAMDKINAMVQSSLYVNGELVANASVSLLSFSPDSKHLGYVAVKGSGTSPQQSVVIDGKAGATYDYVRLMSSRDNSTTFFSADNKNTAYTAKRGSEYFLIVNSKEQKTHFEADAPQFSTKGDIAYIDHTYDAKTQQSTYTAMLNDHIIGSYDYIDPAEFHFTANGSLAFVAYDNNDVFVVMNGNEKKHYQGGGIKSLVTSADGQHIAYVRTDSPPTLIYASGQKGLTTASQTFTPFVVFDDKQQKGYASIANASPSSQLTMSPDGRHIAYLVTQSSPDSTFVVTDGNEGKKYWSIDALHFTSDGSIGYHATTLQNTFVQVQGVTTETPSIELTGMVYAPGSNTSAYITGETKKYVTAGNSKSDAYDAVWPLTFSTDGKSVIYGARVGSKIMRVVQSIR